MSLTIFERMAGAARAARRGLRRFGREERAVAATEFALVFPLAVGLFLGAMDLGGGLLAARKMVRASHTVGDLLAREAAISDADLGGALDAGALILEPYGFDRVGWDVIGIDYPDDDGRARVAWRDTAGMAPDPRFPGRADELGRQGEGVLAVVMIFSYEPNFFGFVTEDIEFRETAVLRGRKTPFIPRVGVDREEEP